MMQRSCHKIGRAGKSGFRGLPTRIYSFFRWRAPLWCGPWSLPASRWCA